MLLQVVPQVVPVGVDVAAVGAHGGVPLLQPDLGGEGKGPFRLEGLAVDVVHQVARGLRQALVPLAADVAGAPVEPHVAEVVLEAVEPQLAVLAVGAAADCVLHVGFQVVHFVVNRGEGVAADLAGVEEPIIKLHGKSYVRLKLNQ